MSMDCTECGASPGRRCFGSCPDLHRNNPVYISCDNGKTLRDEFAMAAFTLLLTHYDKNYADKTIVGFAAYAYADAMMKAREGK